MCIIQKNNINLSSHFQQLMAHISCKASRLTFQSFWESIFRIFLLKLFSFSKIIRVYWNGASRYWRVARKCDLKWLRENAAKLNAKTESKKERKRPAIWTEGNLIYRLIRPFSIFREHSFFQCGMMCIQICKRCFDHLGKMHFESIVNVFSKY